VDPPPFLSACLQSGECISTSPVNTIRSGRGDGGAVVGDSVVGDAVVDVGTLDDVVAGDVLVDDVVDDVLEDDGRRAGSDPIATVDDGGAGTPPSARPIRTPASAAHAVTMIAASTTNALRLLTCSHRHPPIARPYIGADSVAWHSFFIGHTGTVATSAS
jgi:hypothetical protein